MAVPIPYTLLGHCEPEMFVTDLGRSGSRIPAFGCSAVLHAGLCGALSLMSFWPARLPLPHLTAQPPTELRIQGRLYYVTPLQPRTALPIRVANVAPGRQFAKPRPSNAPVPAPRPQPAKDALIQPGVPIIASFETDLPAFKIWAENPLPKIPRPFVEPGRSTVVGSHPAEWIEPVPEALVVKMATVDPLPGHLVLPATPPPPEPVQFASTVQGVPPDQAGERIQILSMNSRPVEFQDRLLIPPGSTSAGKVPSGWPSAGSDNAVSTEANRAPAAGGASSNGSAGSGEKAEASGQAGTGAGSREGIVQILPRPSSAWAKADSNTIKEIRRPVTGNFDSVIIQPSGVPLEEGENLLRGRPVYTVYIAAGTQKDWVLYYCLPEDTTGQPVSAPVTSGKHNQAVRPPWPTRMLIPPVMVPPGERRILIHGFVDASGRFELVRMVRPGLKDFDEPLLAALSAWEFRPATRDGVNVRIEAILAIPANEI